MSESLPEAAAASSSLDRLRKGDLGRWPNISAAASLSAEKLGHLARLTGDLLSGGEGALIVFGSLARSEYTLDSDLDWTILIDGRVKSDHLQDAHRLHKILDKAGYHGPGRTGIFGGLTFSHDLVHAIGGDEDTNRNTTRRLLLLLESLPIDVSESALVHERTIKAVLDRYVKEDASFMSGKNSRSRVPRFLLNDVVRFWRTMAVDYANKYRARGGEGWALRNIKLRMSRKLLFVSGLFMCMSWAMQEFPQESDEFIEERLVGYLQEWISRPPLEALASIVELYAPALAEDIFGSYDEFLALLNNREQRKALEKLPSEQAFGDDLFKRARGMASTFDRALTRLLFASNDKITVLTQKYGVF